jgi:hypothetical protein
MNFLGFSGPRTLAEIQAEKRKIVAEPKIIETKDKDVKLHIDQEKIAEEKKLKAILKRRFIEKGIVDQNAQEKKLCENKVLL